VRSCFGSCFLATARTIGEAWRRLCMADGCPIDLMDGPAPERERRHGETKGREGKGTGKGTRALPQSTIIIIAIYYHHLLLHNPLLYPLNCCFALCHTQHNSAYPLLSIARADTHIQLFLSHSRLLNTYTHTRTLASPPSLAPPLYPTDRKPRSSSQPLPSRPTPLRPQQPYHRWSPMRSAQ
jgi:hypothetical protein